MPESVAVIGAGLVGSLSALGLAHQGYKVTLFDLRPDPRKLSSKADSNLRSINLAVSERGIRAMNYVDPEMTSRLLDGVVPMYGRMIHDLHGGQESQIYGLFGESINSIDRSELNEGLLDAIDSFNKTSDAPIDVKFEHKLTGLSFDSDGSLVTVSYKGEKIDTKFDFVVGADGSFSQVRSFLQRNIRMNYSQEFIDMCYLELFIPPGPMGSFSIDPNHLHIWPRKNFMLIALPNRDGSFTSTFFGPWELTESINTPDKIERFFIENFPDAVELIGMDEVIECFMTHPKGSLMQVNCNQYHYQGKCVIIGDAAHSMVPFYGQGMNCGFEDVRILLELLKEHKGDRATAFEMYTSSRSEDLKTILKLAWDNYHEMSTKVISSLYLLRKKLDSVLGRLIPRYWVPMYTMISFRSDISYSKAVYFEKRQTKILKGVEFGLLTATAVGLVNYFARRAR